jgi:hypothetical protein
MIIPGRSSVMKKTIHLPLVQSDGRNLVNLPYTHLSHLLYSALTPYMLTPQGSTPKGQTAAADLGTDYRRGVFFLSSICPRYSRSEKWRESLANRRSRRAQEAIGRARSEVKAANLGRHSLRCQAKSRPGRGTLPAGGHGFWRSRS